MFRLVLFLLLVLALGAGFAWLADTQGNLVITVQEQPYEVSLMVAAAAFVALFFGTLFIWKLISMALNSPRLFSRWRKNRRKDRGYNALSKGLVAAHAGDAMMARRLTKESKKLLNNEPLTELLIAQTAILEGKRDEARDKFEAMLENPETKLLGLRGLYLEAERMGEASVAGHYAERALEAAPGLPWAGNATLKIHSAKGNWETALKVLEDNKATKLIERDEAKHLRAVLLTANAQSMEEKNPEKALTHAVQAHKLENSFVPAAVTAARIATRLGNMRKASKIVETTWKLVPHPELAEVYIHGRTGDSAQDRYKRAEKLAKLQSNHIESNYVIAKAAIDIGDWEKARDTMVSILRDKPTQRACLIMADIEEGENGDQGRMREWLSRAVRAPKDAAWTADGQVSENWAPISPVTGELDAFEWKVPVEQLGHTVEVEDYAQITTPVVKPEDMKTIEAVEVETVEAEVVEVKNETKSEDDKSDDGKSDVDKKADKVDKEDKKKSTIEITPLASEAAIDVPDDVNGSDKDQSESEPVPAKFPLKKRPDDPGVREGVEPAEEKKGFKLF
jgi:HemY protein